MNLSSLALAFVSLLVAKVAFPAPPEGQLSAGKKQAEPATKTRVRLLLSVAEAQPGGEALVGVLFTMPKPWHVYWRNAGDAGFPPEVKWQLPAGITVGKLLWPTPSKYPFAQRSAAYVYHREVMLLAPLRFAGSMTPGKKVIQAQVTWLECNKSCLSGKTKAQVTLVVGEKNRPSQEAASFRAWQAKLPLVGPPPGLVAQLDDGGPDETHVLRLELPAPKETILDFYPYSSDRYQVLAPTKTKKKRGRVTLIKQVEKTADDWPNEIAGLLVTTIGDQSAKAHEVVLQVGRK
tara:strand:- start:88 stop:960 length:873 start_codon:yes stop_codon:yes gene_type:complete